MASTLPKLPVPHADLVKHITRHPDTPLTELIEPYRKYEAQIRQAFAQDPGNELLKDPYINVLPLFNEDTPDIKIRARNLAAESEEEKSKYIMPLPNDVRRTDGSPAVVPHLKDFQRNFSVFSESSLAELNWSNVIAAGSSVVNCLLPVPDEYGATKRGLREFYHEKFCPASDVDLFLYGLTEEEAVEKIKDIETKVRDVLLTETTTVRTKHAITICRLCNICGDPLLSCLLLISLNRQPVSDSSYPGSCLYSLRECGRADEYRLSSAFTIPCPKF